MQTDFWLSSLDSIREHSLTRVQAPLASSSLDVKRGNTAPNPVVECAQLSLEVAKWHHAYRRDSKKCTRALRISAKKLDPKLWTKVKRLKRVEIDQEQL